MSRYVLSGAGITINLSHSHCPGATSLSSPHRSIEFLMLLPHYALSSTPPFLRYIRKLLRIKRTDCGGNGNSRSTINDVTVLFSDEDLALVATRIHLLNTSAYTSAAKEPSSFSIRGVLERVYSAEGARRHTRKLQSKKKKGKRWTSPSIIIRREYLHRFRCLQLTDAAAGTQPRVANVVTTWSTPCISL